MRDFKSSPSFTNHRKKNNTPIILTLLIALFAGGGYWFMASESNPESIPTTSRKQITVPLPLPPPQKSQAAQLTQSTAKDTIAEIDWRTYKVKSGDSLSRIFNQQGWLQQQLHQLVSIARKTQDLRILRPGEIIKYRLDTQGQLAKLSYKLDQTRTKIITFNAQKTVSEVLIKPTYTHIARKSGVIKTSLSNAAQTAGLTPKQILGLADIFGWDIDFALDIRMGDTFNTLIEETTLADNTLVSSNILAAEFTNQGKKHKAVRYTTPEGQTSYYTPKGINLKKTFLRTPVKFARISSHFNLRRKHPILNRVRAHKGVDYAASTGTPIRATANGKIVHRARKGGYGKTIILQHGNHYSTLYAHMSHYKKGLRRGSSIKQGQVIGYVGQSGLATGPHLHYEFRVNGNHKDPLKVKFPKNRPLNQNYLADFLKTSKPLLVRLDTAEDLIASNP